MSRVLVTLLLALYALMAPGLRTEGGSGSDDQLVEISWKAATHPGAPPITLHGTAEQVYAKLVEINSNYDDDFKDIEPELEPTGSLDKRKDTLVCEGERYAKTSRFQEGINYLRKVKGSPQLSPYYCGRVSCSYHSAIVWCNDSPYSKTLPSSINIAEGAQVIVNGCDDDDLIKGWLDHTDRWRVVVRSVVC